ncbi:MAG: hypothetical protein ACHQ53_11515 [Polyangiales bacterium]
MRPALAFGSLALAALLAPAAAHAADPFEIQVYDGTSNAPGVPGLELHANRVMSGVKTADAPELPSNHQTHLTLEPSLGVTHSWELGAYLQSALLADGRFDFAGAKLRSKLVSPPGWDPHWRIGVNVELSYLPPKFERSRTGLELRPIAAWENDHWLFAANPIIGLALGRPGRSDGPTFEPALMALYKWPGSISAGIEYYSDLGAVGRGFSSWSQQAHYLFEVVNLLAVERVELNLGVGEGLTHASDPITIKLIAGYAWEPEHTAPRKTP